MSSYVDNSNEVLKQQGYVIEFPKNKKKKSKSILRSNLDELALTHFEAPVETVPARHELYVKNLQEFSSKILSYEDKWEEEFVSLALSYVKKASRFYFDFKRKVSPSKLIQGISGGKKIHLGLLRTGLAQDENSALIDRIVEKVKKGVKNLSLARLNVNNLISVQSAFSSIRQQLIDSTINDDDEVFEINYTSTGLKRWAEKNPNQDVLIVIDDIDFIERNIIKDLLRFLNDTESLNFSFTILMGQLHGFLDISSILDDDLICVLQITNLHGVDPKKRFEFFIEKLIFNWSIPFRLSGDIIEQFCSYFNNFSSSIRRLSQIYQMCLLDHFRSPPSLFLNSNVSDPSSFWDSHPYSKIKRSDNESLMREILERVPSLVEMIQKEGQRSKLRSPSKKPKIDSEETLKIDLVDKIKDFLKELREWYECLLILFAFSKNLPDSLLGDTKTELFIRGFNGSICKSDENSNSSEDISTFNKIVQLVKHTSLPQMRIILNDALLLIRDFYKENSSVEIFQNNGSYEEILVNFIKGLDDAEIKDKKLFTQNSRDNEEKDLSPVLSKKGMTTAQLRNVLLKKIKEKDAEKATAFIEQRELIINFLEDSIQPKLKLHVNKISFSEIFVYTNSAFVSRQLFPNSEKAIHLALCLPHKYLNCACCSEIDMYSNLEQLPDISILYKLYLERMFKIINLNDFFESFSAIVDIDPEPGRRKSKSQKALKAQEEKNKNLILRFNNALSELEFLGFIARSTNSTSKTIDEAEKVNFLFST